MAKSDKFRVFGPALGVQDSYVDVQVSGIDEEGNLYLQSVNDTSRAKRSREWQVSTSEVETLLSENRMLRNDQVVKHKIWDHLDNLTKARKDDEVTVPFAVEHVERAQKELFDAVFEETR